MVTSPVLEKFMIQVDDLALFYHGLPVFEGVCFTLNSKERCGLVGRNGSGKTSLMRLLVGQEKADKGTISFPKGYKLGYLDQHIHFSAPTVLEEACLGLKEEEKDAVYKAEHLLCGLGFKEEELDQDPHLMSGGYQLRLHLTKVLLSEPNCLLLDEPTNYLDILSIRFLSKFLRQFKGELILISHDREFMDSVTTHTLGVHRHKVQKCTGGTTALFELIAQEEEIYEKTRLNQEKKREHLQSFIERFGAKASKATQAQSKQKMLNRIPALEKLKTLYDLEFHFHERPFHGKKMFSMQEVCFAYTQEVPLIQHLSFSIEKGEHLAIIGKNGYGKSTLLKIMTGELTPQTGTLQLSDQVSIGYFGQTHIQRLPPQSSVEEEIASANPTLNITEVKSLCGKMLFGGDLSKKKIAVLSGGEKSRVLLGKILAKPCNLLLLDEPTHHLDIESIEALIDALEDFEGSIVMVTHSELILNRLQLKQLIVCHESKQTPFTGTYEEFLEKVGWEEESSSPKKGVDKEEKRKKHEERERFRSRIKSLETELKKLERSLAELEARQKQEQQALLKNEQLEKIQQAALLLEGTEKQIRLSYEKFLAIEEELSSLRKILSS